MKVYDPKIINISCLGYSLSNFFSIYLGTEMYVRIYTHIHTNVTKLYVGQYSKTIIHAILQPTFFNSQYIGNTCHGCIAFQFN